jgi:hypothetical protein
LENWVRNTKTDGPYDSGIYRLYLLRQRFQNIAVTLDTMLKARPGYITTADADIVLQMSAFLSSPGEVQLNFARVVKENYESVSSLALALIGWIEYVPTTMLCALSRLGNAAGRMWCGRISVQSLKCCRFMQPKELQTGGTSPAYAVAFVPRPLPLDRRDSLMTKYQWVDSLEGDGAYSVSSGVSRELVLANLKYLNWAYAKIGAKISLPDFRPASHIVIGVNMVMLWFTCLGEDVGTIVT